MSRYLLHNFKDVFRKVDRKIELEDLIEYSCVGIQLYGLGAYIRERLLGSEIKRKTQWKIKTGDFIYNKLFAWKGTFAIAANDVDDCIVSDKFPTFVFDRDIVDESYLRYYVQCEHLWRQAELMSKGAAALSKFTLNPPDFWRLQIPLPDIVEQRRIASFLDQSLSRLKRIAAMRERIDAVVQGRRAGIGSEPRLLMIAALARMNERFGGNLGILDDVLDLRPRSGPSFPCDESGIGIPVIMPSALGGFRFDESKCLFGNGTEKLHDMDIIEPEDLLISRGNKRDQVGLCIVYEPEKKVPRTYANLLMRMKVKKHVVLPKFVKYWFMTPLAVDYVQKHTKGTSPAIQKINQGALIRLPFPKEVSLETQADWIDYLERVFYLVEALEMEIRKQFSGVQQLRTNILREVFEGLYSGSTESIDYNPITALVTN